MTRIAKLSKGYYVNFDDHCLYSKEDNKIVEINNKPIELLEFFCEHPNRYMRTDVINDLLEEGCVSSEAIRSRIKNLRNSHPVFWEVLPHSSSGYKYVGGVIEDKLAVSQEDRTFEYFLQAFSRYETDFIKSLVYCPCKWGPCSLDEIQQNTNTCEGVLAIMSSSHKARYTDIIEDAIEYLIDEATNKGLTSKSLGEETVVPTAMLLLIAAESNLKSNDKIKQIANTLWDSHSKNGWGIYVRNMDVDANIGCTYWAIKALCEYDCIPNDSFQKYLRSLFRYTDSYAFGNSVDDYRSKMPHLYSTSMMYLVYECLSKDSKRKIEGRYNPKEAINFIVGHFDESFLLVESEGISGVEASGKTWVHTVNWSHMSIHYALLAIATAIQSDCFSSAELLALLQRIERVLVDNCEVDNGHAFWAAPNMSLDKGKRGKMIYPTMHLIMGISSISDALSYFLNKHVK